MPEECHLLRASGTSSKTTPSSSLFRNPVLHTWPCVKISHQDTNNSIRLFMHLLLTCSCFNAVIFLSAFIIASTFATKAATTSSLPSSLEGTGTTPTMPASRSSWTYKSNAPFRSKIVNRKQLTYHIKLQSTDAHKIITPGDKSYLKSHPFFHKAQTIESSEPWFL